jgi:hypothetical protein
MEFLETFDELEFRGRLDADGFVLVSGVVANDQIANLRAELDVFAQEHSASRDEPYSARNLLVHSSVRALVHSCGIDTLVTAALGPHAFPVRGILFDKVPGANWSVGWHQDKIIPVAERVETAGFSAWSLKRGVVHVRPPAAVLSRMLTLRVHLDDTLSQNGALCVIPASHNQGIIEDTEVQEQSEKGVATVCEASAGSVLAMRPLLLHASSRAKSPTHRRVVHLEFAGDKLPGQLRWPIWA